MQMLLSHTFTWQIHKYENVARLTDCDGIIDFEAAEHLVDVSGVKKPVSSHHHLEGLWLHNTHRHDYISHTWGSFEMVCVAHIIFILHQNYINGL